MTRTFDPIREMDRLLSDVTRTPATVAVPMDLYREGVTTPSPWTFQELIQRPLISMSTIAH